MKLISHFTNHLHYLRCHIKKPAQICSTKVQKNVVITMTTILARINKIWPTLNSITLQSLQPENIFLWIPKQFKRFPNQVILNVPNFLSNYPNIKIQFIDHDYGPASKLLPCLQLFSGQDTKIIIIDDDRIYPPHFIYDLLKYEQIDPSAAIGIAGTIMHGSKRHEYRATKKMMLVDVLLGYNGMLVKPTFFAEDIFYYPPSLPEAFFEEDVWVSRHLQKRNIRRILTPSLSGWQSIVLGNKRSNGLCEHENKDKENFNRVYNYLFGHN